MRMRIRIKEMDKYDLLRHVLLYEHNIREYELLYSKNGKPSIKGENIYFNLSTSKNISAIATNDSEVGISIKHYFYNQEIMEKYFNEKEKEIIKKSKSKKEDFTKIYVLKIAYVKMLGENKNYPIQNIDTTKLKHYWMTITRDYMSAAIISQK